MFSETLMNDVKNFVTGKSVSLSDREQELILVYLNDLNSSYLRETITALACGYAPIEGKHGRDCMSSEGKEKEIKPQLYTTKPLDGKCNFSDYTRDRLEKDSADKIDIISSGFANNKLIYAIEYSFDAIKNVLDERVKTVCEQGNQKYVRSNSSNYRHWIDHPSVKIHYIDEEFVKNNPKFFNKKFREKLLEIAIRTFNRTECVWCEQEANNHEEVLHS